MCRPHERAARLVQDPILIVEVLSPGTERHGRRTKVPGYREIESVQEIPLIDSEAAYAEIFQRQGSVWFSEIVKGRDVDFPLCPVGLQFPTGRFMRGSISKPM